MEKVSEAEHDYLPCDLYRKYVPEEIKEIERKSKGSESDRSMS